MGFKRNLPIQWEMKSPFHVWELSLKLFSPIVDMFGHSNEHEVELWIMKILRGRKWLEESFLLGEKPYDKEVIAWELENEN